MAASFAATVGGYAMKVNRTFVNDPDYEAEAVAYVDEEDYTMDCDDLDDTEMLAAGRCTWRPDQD